MAQVDALAHAHPHPPQTPLELPDSLDGVVVHLNFVGCQKPRRIHGLGAHGTKWNFLVGDESQWGTGAQDYDTVVVEGLYPGTDLRLFFGSAGLKYEFLLAPGADPRQVRLRYEGLDSLSIRGGQLHCVTPVATYGEARPIAYQPGERGPNLIPCAFELKNQEVRFDLPKRYNKKKPLVLDPELIFSTFTGSTADNWGNTACFDTLGNLYAAGTVFQFRLGPVPGSGFGQFPTTPGAFRTAFQGGTVDVAALKFNTTGTTLLYGTYLGGNGSDVPTSTVTTPNGELIILGTTGSTNFPTTVGAYQPTNSLGFTLCGGWFCGPNQVLGGYDFIGGTDLFVAKLSADGTTLLASTYLGGASNDGIMRRFDPLVNNYGDELRGDVVLDELGNIYVASNSGSASIPGFLNGRVGGNYDAIAFSLDPNFTTLRWGRYLGSFGDDAAYSIFLDGLNQPYVVGGTNDPVGFFGFPGTVNPSPSGNVDGFLTHIAADGSAVLNSTYLGTSAFDQSYFVQVDLDGDVYVLGQTYGDYPIFPDTVYQNPRSGHFIHKLTPDLSTTLFSTVFGDLTNALSIRPKISPTAFLVNECENLFVSGWGGQTNGDLSVYNGNNTFNMPLTPGAFQTTTNGSSFYLAAFKADMDTLLYATYFGGIGLGAEHVDGGTSRFDRRGIVYQSVCAGCGGNNLFPTTAGVWSNTNNSLNCNNGLFKFDLASLDADFLAVPACDPLYTVDFTNTTLGGLTYLWDFGDGTTLSLSSPIGVQHTYDTAGTYTVKLFATDATTCIGIDSTEQVITLDNHLVPERQDTALCVGDSVLITVGGGFSDLTYAWSPSAGVSDSTAATVQLAPTQTTTYVVTITDTLGCVRLDTVRVEVIDLTPNAGYTIIGSCAGVPRVRFDAGNLTAENYLWAFGDGQTSDQPRLEYTYQNYGTYQVIVQLTSPPSCADADTLNFTLEPFEVPNIITPNGDGINESFFVRGLENSGEWKLQTYNRWGNLIFEDGYYHNQWQAPGTSDGTYYYLLSAPDGSACKGWVQIVR